MDFRSEDEKMYFLEDIPYYGSPNSYCLGDTLEEAAVIVNRILDDTPTEKEGVL